MVGQTTHSRGREYQYYRCRHVYTSTTGGSCEGRYVRADGLEEGVWDAIEEVVSRPEIVTRELALAAEREREEGGSQSDLVAELEDLTARERRLVRLLGGVDDDVVRDELQTTAARRAHVQAELDRGAVPALADLMISDLDEVSALVKSWLADASDDDRMLLLEALQIEARRRAMRRPSTA